MFVHISFGFQVLVWYFWRKSFTEHFSHEEDDDGSEKTSASKEIYQGETGGSEHGSNY